MLLTQPMNPCKRARLLAITTAAVTLYLIPLFAAAQGDTKEVDAEGIGETIAEARRNAVREAVEQAVGTIVDAETLVENDEIVRNEILTHSNGYVESMKVLSATKSKRTGLVTIRVHAVVRTSKLQQKLSEAMETCAEINGEGLFAEMLSRQNLIKDSEKMFAHVFAGHREDRLLEAGVVLREDGKPAIDLEPNTGMVTVPVRLSVNDRAWNSWCTDACRRFSRMCEKTEPFKPRYEGLRYQHNDYDGKWKGPRIVVDKMHFFFSDDYAATINRQHYYACPKRQWVRVALVDRKGNSIAAQYIKTEDFGRSPLEHYEIDGRQERNYFESFNKFIGRSVDMEPNFETGNAAFAFIRGKPVTKKVVFEGLSLENLKATAQIVCLVGELSVLQTRGDSMTRASINAMSDAGRAKSASAAERGRDKKAVATARKIIKDMVQIPGKNYLLCKYEVTVAQWYSIMRLGQSDEETPVSGLSWDECQSFLAEFNALPVVKESGLTFRLPTEEEWTFACLAGATGGFCRLADGSEITLETVDEVGWFRDSSGERPFVVGLLKPNAFGLYDMLGNVSEWTQTEVGLFGGRYVVCGGNYGSFNSSATSATMKLAPSTRHWFTGFRLCATENGVDR